MFLPAVPKFYILGHHLRGRDNLITLQWGHSVSLENPERHTAGGEETAVRPPAEGRKPRRPAWQQHAGSGFGSPAVASPPSASPPPPGPACLDPAGDTRPRLIHTAARPFPQSRLRMPAPHPHHRPPLLAAGAARSRLRMTLLPFTLTGTCNGLSLGATVMSESESESCPSSMSPASCAIFPRRGAAGQESTSGGAAGRSGWLRLLGRPREGAAPAPTAGAGPSPHAWVNVEQYA